MAIQTANYGFIKPNITDASDIRTINSNWDTLDAELKKMDDDLNSINETLSSGTLQSQITYGTSAPSGGEPGDVYIQLIEE
jgi:hypothetical protein